MPATTDEAAAILAISSLNDPSKEQQAANEKVDAIIKACDDGIFPDIHELFALYNVLYFRSLLLPRVEVSWSSRLTLCAGICELVRDEEGKYRRIRLKLSEPLLKYRPMSDTIDTLLHEAIHAYFFVTTSWRHSRGDDGTGHGEGFLLLADAINNHNGYNITVYHTFHDEVDSYRNHIWKCNGPCQSQPPFFGLVKRSMNRAPSKSDQWWTKHQEECGGTYVKIAEPEPTQKQLQSMPAKARAGRQKNKLDAWMMPLSLPTDDSSSTDNVSVPSDSATKRSRSSADDQPVLKRVAVACPICNAMVAQASINEHLDVTHSD